MDKHPVLDRIITLAPTELRDEQTGVYSYNEVAINQYVKIIPKFQNARDPDGNLRKSLVGLILKGAAKQRKRTYLVKETDDKPVSYHFWKVVKRATERQMKARMDVDRQNKIKQTVFDATKDYQELMVKSGADPLPQHYKDLAAVGNLSSFAMGSNYRDTFLLQMDTSTTTGPVVTSFTINRKHLSVSTIRQIMELVQADVSKPADLMDQSALKKVRTSLFG